MTTYADLGEWALATLKATTAVTDLVQAGVDGVLESGDVSNLKLEEWQKARRDVATTDKVLAVFVQDTGEIPRAGQRESTFSVWVYDRGLAYSNIRTVREAVLTALLGQPVSLVRSALIVAVDFRGRTGHAIDSDFDLDLERVDLFGPVVAIEPDEYA